MEIFLLIIAGGILYFLYVTLQDYLKNPLHPKNQDKATQKPNIYNQSKTPEYTHIPNNPYEDMDPLNKLRKSEYGVLSAILGSMAKADKNVCELEKNLRDSMLSDMEKESMGKAKIEDLKEIFDDPKEDIESLAQRFNDISKGEYKKRLKVVEFLFAFAYSDGVLDDREKEMLLDIGAYFELENDDFNAIYNEFENAYAKESKMTKNKAMEIFDIQKDIPQNELDSKYHDLILSKKQNILENKNIDKSFKDEYLNEIKNIDIAYQILSKKASKKDDKTE